MPELVSANQANEKGVTGHCPRYSRANIMLEVEVVHFRLSVKVIITKHYKKILVQILGTGGVLKNIPPPIIRLTFITSILFHSTFDSLKYYFL